jgi:hypothetical protein
LSCGNAPREGAAAGPDFSNDWKNIFQWLEKMAEIFQ